MVRLGSQKATVKRKGRLLSTFGERLRSERERLGLSQPAFGDLCGVGKHSQINYETGRRAPDSDYLMAAMNAGVDVHYLITGERSAASIPGMMLQSMSGALADPSEFLQVPVYEVSLAAGAGALNYGEEVIAHLAFRKDWLRGIGASPSSTVVARAHGESMAPTLRDGDVVLIDRSRADPPARPRDPRDKRPPAIFALVDDGHARIKRVELAAPGTLAILSDNPEFPPEFRPAAAVALIGRVLWWGHTNRE